MNRKCKVAISDGAEEVKQSKLLFKKEWAEILMSAEETSDMNFHTVTGTLIAFSGGQGVISLGDGIMLLFPVHHIRLIEK